MNKEHFRDLPMREPQSIWKHYNAPRSFTKTIELTCNLGGFECVFEVSLKLWENNEQFPEVEFVSTVDAYDNGGRQLMDKDKLVLLNMLAYSWCGTHIDNIISEIERAEKKERE